MAVTGIEWHGFSGWGNGYQTVDINIAPSTVGVQTALYGQSGGGTNFTGIKHYRQRQSDGSDRDIDFGDWTSWPPVIFDHISSVTIATATGDSQQAWLTARMDYWG
jgi:hypothetical protein